MQVGGKKVSPNLILLLSDIVDRVVFMLYGNNSNLRALRLFLLSNDEILKEMPPGWQQEFKNISVKNVNMIWHLENSVIQNILKV